MQTQHTPILTDAQIIDNARRRPWVDGKTLAELVNISYTTIRKYATLPGCPVVRAGNRNRYDVDIFRNWLADGGPRKGEKELGRQLVEKHGK